MTAKKPEVTLFLYLSETEVDRPLSRALRDRAAALSFGAGKFVFAEVGAGEKPHLLRPAGAHLNVTHSKHLFLCAVADAAVGLDAEWTDGRREMSEALIRRVFSAGEAERLFALPGRERTREALSLWTAHEAAAKFSGRGLADVLRTNELPDLVYTDLGSLFESLSIPAVGTLVTRDVPQIELCFLED